MFGTSVDCEPLGIEKEEDEVLEKLREVITDGMDGVRHVLVFT